MPVTRARPDALLLAGPTASGKSEWALRLAERCPIEIVSVDSAQVYRGLDIGTAKPDLRTRAQVPHHLIDIRDAASQYSAGDFVADAVRLIPQIQARGRLPVLVGGTMLYFRSLIRGMAAIPLADPAIRRDIDVRAAVHGWPAIHAELARVDPASAARIHPNDPQRLQRALEVYVSTGRPLSEWHAEPARDHNLRFRGWALVPGDRASLHHRIQSRFTDMIDRGWVDEVLALRARGDLDARTPSLRAVGYRQLWTHVAEGASLQTAVSRGIAATRQLAKRQLTWIRGEPGWAVVNPQDQNALGEWLGAVVDAN